MNQQFVIYSGIRHILFYVLVSQLFVLAEF